MPLYHYHAIDTSGKKRSGLLEAHNEREAKDKLRDQGLMLSQLSTKVQISSKQNLKGDVLVAFTVQVSQLINAGVPLYESLLAIEEQYRTESFHRIILSLCEQIKAGVSLSEAMGNYPDSFDKLYCSMISAGESVGALGIVLDKLSKLLAKQNKLKKQITTAMIYPGILASFSLLIIFLLLGFVVPSIEGIFADRQLNGFTEFVLKLSHLFRDYWWIYFPLLGALITFLVLKIRSPAGKLWMERHFLKVPLIRTLMIQTSIARFCRTMGTMQQGGLTMIDSLRLAREVMRNVVLEEEVKNAENKIIETIRAGSNPAQPDVTRRVVQNEVRIPDGQTVIIGGLRRKNIGDTKESIPFLGELPGIGKLFSVTTMTDDSTEMFICITPKIIVNPAEDLERLRCEEMARRPGDIPSFLCELVAAREAEKNRMLRGTMQLLFGRVPERCIVPVGEYDGR